MSAANRIVKEGGSIISVVACEDGIPNFGGYFDILHRVSLLDQLVEMVHTPELKEPDQWQVQIQAQIQRRADVYIYYSDGLTNEEIWTSLFIPCRDISATVDGLIRKYGEDTTIAVLPEGLQSFP